MVCDLSPDMAHDRGITAHALSVNYLQVYSSTVMPCVRAHCLGTITKLLAVGSSQQLQTVLADLPISSFVAGLMTSRDLKAQSAAIQMAEILMAKLPQVFSGFFVKEGVAHALEQLAAGATDDVAAADAGAKAGGAAAAAGEGRRPSSGGASLPPPSPPVTRSRRSSKADQVRRQGIGWFVRVLRVGLL
jgi:E3 ubiquitin-protein ligase TRIP12